MGFLDPEADSGPWGLYSNGRNLLAGLTSTLQRQQCPKGRRSCPSLSPRSVTCDPAGPGWVRFPGLRVWAGPVTSTGRQNVTEVAASAPRLGREGCMSCCSTAVPTGHTAPRACSVGGAGGTGSRPVQASPGHLSPRRASPAKISWATWPTHSHFRQGTISLHLWMLLSICECLVNTVMATRLIYRLSCCT